MPGVTKRTILTYGTSTGICGEKRKKKKQMCPFINEETFQP